jgi:hypothetical protein
VQGAVERANRGIDLAPYLSGERGAVDPVRERAANELVAERRVSVRSELDLKVLESGACGRDDAHPRPPTNGRDDRWWPGAEATRQPRARARAREGAEPGGLRRHPLPPRTCWATGASSGARPASHRPSFRRVHECGPAASVHPSRREQLEADRAQVHRPLRSGFWFGSVPRARVIEGVTIHPSTPRLRSAPRDFVMAARADRFRPAECFASITHDSPLSSDGKRSSTAIMRGSEAPGSGFP